MKNKRGEATRESIREKSCAVFSRHGFKSVTMKDICEATGLSRGGLYCHYSGTAEIFIEIMHGLLERQGNEFHDKMKQNLSAVTILDEILKRYEYEMRDSDSSLSIAIYEFFSMPEHCHQGNTIEQQYILSSTMWEELIQYGIDRGEFKAVNISAVYDLIVFSYQGVRMYSKLMPIHDNIPRNIMQEIRNILVAERGSQ